MTRKWWWLSLMTVVLGCGVPSFGKFGPKGFQNTQFQFEVEGQYLDLVGEGWLLDNYTRHNIEPKVGPAYTSDYQLDSDGDGSRDTNIERATYDLRFKHEKSEGLIWLRSFPIGQDLQEKELGVLAKMVVDAIANENHNLARFGADSSSVKKSVRVEIASQTPAKLGSLDALVLQLNVFEAQAAADAKPKRRSEIVLLRLPKPYTVQLEASKKFPIVMLLGYANAPDAFDAQLKDFRTFVDRVRIQDDHKLSVSAPVAKEAPEKTEAADAADAGTPEPEPTDAASAPAEPTPDSPSEGPGDGL